MASGSEIVQWSSLSKGDREAVAWAVTEIDRLRTDLAAAQTEPVRPMLSWTTKTPTDPGCYWTRDDKPSEPVLVTVQRKPNGELWMEWMEVCNLSNVAEWWGPIPRPPKSP